MANKFPLILNTSANQIQELASGDNLDLTGSGIHNAGVITATSFSGNITGGVTGNADTATLATNVTVSANNSTNETVYPIFVDGATGTQGAESDTGLTYNPSSGNLTATQFTGTLQTAAQPNITSVGTLSALNVSGTVSIGGTLTYEDVTNIDSVGLITARNGVSVTSGGIKVLAGGSNFNATITGTATTATTIAVASETTDTLCFPIFTNTGVGNNAPKVNTSKLSFNSATGALSATTFVGNGDFVELDVDGHTNLDNVSIVGLTTFSEDVKFTGATSGRDILWDKSQNRLEFADNAAAMFGTDEDLLIYQDNSNSYIDHSGAGDLRIRSLGSAEKINLLAAGDVVIKTAVTPSSDKDSIVCTANYGVDLYYNNSPKIQTTNTGAVVTGICTATTFKGAVDATTGAFSGDATFSGGSGAITLSANSDIRLANGSWTGDYGAKIQHHDNYLFLQGGSNGVNLRNAAGSRQLMMSNDGHFGPSNGQAYNLGSSALPWTNSYHKFIDVDSASSTNNHTLANFNGNATSGNMAGLKIHYYECGSDDNRSGLYWQHENVGNHRMWMDDAGFLRQKSTNPTSDTDGNAYVKLGTTNPASTLTISGTGGIIKSQTTSGTGSNYMQFSDSSGNQMGYVGYGSGSSNKFYIVQQKSDPIDVYIDGASRWQWSGTTGHYLPFTNNQVNIGSSSNKVKRVYAVTGDFDVPFGGSTSSTITLGSSLSSGTWTTLINTGVLGHNYMYAVKIFWHYQGNGGTPFYALAGFFFCPASANAANAAGRSENLVTSCHVGGDYYLKVRSKMSNSAVAGLEVAHVNWTAQANSTFTVTYKKVF